MSYACSEFKKLSEPAPHHLQEREEARDLLIRILMAQGYCIAIFKFGAVSVAPEMEPKLRGLIGHKCAILRIDGRFLVRDLDGEGHA